MNQLPWCVVCKRPVDALEQDCNIITGEQIFTARCHGETEEVRLTERELVNMPRGGRIGLSRAFATPKLTAQR